MKYLSGKEIPPKKSRMGWFLTFKKKNPHQKCIFDLEKRFKERLRDSILIQWLREKSGVFCVFYSCLIR